MSLSSWWLTKAARIYRWLEKEAKADDSISYERYKEYKNYADAAEYVLKNNNNEENK